MISPFGVSKALKNSEDNSDNRMGCFDPSRDIARKRRSLSVAQQHEESECGWEWKQARPAHVTTYLLYGRRVSVGDTLLSVRGNLALRASTIA
jgi:hypothetical protein